MFVLDVKLKVETCTTNDLHFHAPTKLYADSGFYEVRSSNIHNEHGSVRVGTNARSKYGTSSDNKFKICANEDKHTTPAQKRDNFMDLV